MGRYNMWNIASVHGTSARASLGFGKFEKRFRARGGSRFSLSLNPKP